MALALAREGCSLALVARTEEGLAETAAACRRINGAVRLLVLPCNVTKRDALLLAVRRCVEELGGLNILVANAGIYSQSMEMCMAVNAVSVFQLTDMCVPHIRKESRQKPSAVIFMASLASKLTFKGGAAYCASKHALLGWSGCVFEDIREDDIKVSCIMPGFVNTPMINQRDNLCPSKMIQPEDVAEAVLFVLKFPGTSCPTEIVLRPQHTPYINSAGAGNAGGAGSSANAASS